MAGPINEAANPGETPTVEPTAAEIERWEALERAAREREHRQAHEHGQLRLPTSGETLRSAQYVLREAQLAAEGALSLALSVSVRDMFDLLVRAGREWEDEYTSRPVRRRRVALDMVASDVEGRTESPASKAGSSSEVSPKP